MLTLIHAFQAIITIYSSKSKSAKLTSSPIDFITENVSNFSNNGVIKFY